MRNNVNACICSICSRSFPEDVMYTFSPGGLVVIHECPECHDRGTNHVDTRKRLRNKAIGRGIRGRAS